MSSHTQAASTSVTTSVVVEAPIEKAFFNNGGYDTGGSGAISGQWDALRHVAAQARTMLIEASWCYRFPAREEQRYRARVQGLPEEVRSIAWRAQVRLCSRFRRLAATGSTRYPSVLAAFNTRLARDATTIERVAGLSARDTVETCTPAATATCFIVGWRRAPLDWRFIASGAFFFRFLSKRLYFHTQMQMIAIVCNKIVTA